MVKSKMMRAGSRFLNMKNNLKVELRPSVGRRLSDRELTDGIAGFLEDENLLPIIKRRARKKRGRFF